MVQCHCLNKCFDVYIKFEMIKLNFILFCWWQKIVISFWHYIKLNLGAQFKENSSQASPNNKVLEEGVQYYMKLLVIHKFKNV